MWPTWVLISLGILDSEIDRATGITCCVEKRKDEEGSGARGRNIKETGASMLARRVIGPLEGISTNATEGIQSSCILFSVQICGYNYILIPDLAIYWKLESQNQKSASFAVLEPFDLTTTVQQQHTSFLHPHNSYNRPRIDT